MFVCVCVCVCVCVFSSISGSSSKSFILSMLFFSLRGQIVVAVYMLWAEYQNNYLYLSQ